MRDKLFFFVNGELERTDDPGTNFVRQHAAATPGFGVSRVRAATMDAIRQRMIDAYNYDPGPYEGYINETDNNKLIAKLDWNINPSNTLTFRYNYLDAKRDLRPHPFVLSFANTGRGPNASSLPFHNSGYAINNELHSVRARAEQPVQPASPTGSSPATTGSAISATPFSEAFPTIEIGEGGVTYTTAGPRAVLDSQHPRPGRLAAHQQLQLFPRQAHRSRSAPTSSRSASSTRSTSSGTACSSCRPVIPVGSTFSSLHEFFAATDPANPNQKDFTAMIGSGPFKGEIIDVGQVSLYAQDELARVRPAQR